VTIDIGTSTYSPKCLEAAFCGLRIDGALRSSFPARKKFSQESSHTPSYSSEIHRPVLC
jgi:hypothetical protein